MKKRLPLHLPSCNPLDLPIEMKTLSEGDRDRVLIETKSWGFSGWLRMIIEL